MTHEAPNTDLEPPGYFHFSLGNLLWAMFWFSLTGGSFAALNLSKATLSWPPHDWPKMAIGFVLWLPLFLIVWSPVVGVCTLFGRMRTAIKIGVAIAPPSYAALCILLALG